jgi:general secretion pathway protein G
MYDYPSQQQGLEALIRQPDQLAAGASYRPGGYINRLPNDPWGRPFVYARPGTRSGKPFDIYTLGADGLPGGEGPDADIGNWD